MPRRWWLAALAVAGCRLILLLVLIPPWQQPDEHVHVGIAEVWRTRFTAGTTDDPGRQAEIIWSMADHLWWRHYGREQPVPPLPTRFDLTDVQETIGVDPASPSYPVVYYGSIGWLLSQLPHGSVVRDLYIMRSLSAGLALLTLWMAWRGTREPLGELGAATIVLLLALHPQFAVASTAAGPDALVNLAGAGIWWLAMVALRSGRPLLPLAGMWLVAFAATGIDRMGVSLVASAFALSIALIALRRTRVMRMLAAGGALTAIAGLSLWVADNQWQTLRSAYWSQILPVPKARTWEFFSWFAAFLFRSWWLALGWVRYLAPSWWVAIASLPLALAAAGVFSRLWRPADDRKEGAVLLMAIVMLAVQVGAIYWTYYRLAIGPQGRHLFPCMVPTLVLVWIGVRMLAPTVRTPILAVSLVLVFALLDAAAWLLVALPAYGT